MSQEIALDLKRYNTPEKLTSLAYDTASLSIEASNRLDLPRVNPTFLVKKGDITRAPGRDKRDVAEMFVDGDLSTPAARQILRELHLRQHDFVYVWISPSDGNPNWLESRIQIGIKTETKSKKIEFIKRYDISSSLSPEGCLRLGQYLASMVENVVDYPQDTNQLRQTIFILYPHPGVNPQQFLQVILEEHIPEKYVFGLIDDGTVDKNKAAALRVAVKVTKLIMDNPSLAWIDPRKYGAFIETRMQQEGYGMDPQKSGCGSSNINTSNTTDALIYSSPSLTIESKWEYHTGNCLNCGTKNTLVGPCSICQSCEKIL